MFARISHLGSFSVRLAAVAIALFVGACSGSESAGPGVTPSPTVATLTVNPGQVSLVTGQPQVLEVTAKTAAGAVVASPSIAWTSASTSVASVGSDGRIVGAGVGTTTVTGKSGTAEVNVAVTVTDGAYVTATGGSFTLLGGKVQVDFPANAVTSTTIFTARLESAPVGDPRLLAGTAVVLEPAATFGAVVRIRLTYPSTLAADVVETQLRIARVVGSAWQESSVLPVDRTSHFVWGAISNSGTIAVFVPPSSLRSLAQVRGFDIGSATEPSEFKSDTTFSRILAAEFNSVTPGNAMKFSSIHPQPNQYTFADADTLVGLAVQNGMKVHGHVLVWHNQAPSWITAATQTRTTLLAALKEHIETVVGRYAGRVATWDVANETVSDDGTGLRKTFWINVIGPDVLDSAFTWAHRRDPAAKLYLNEYNAEGINRKSDSLFALATRLKDAGIPIDGVGFQAHFVVGQAPTAASVSANLSRFANAGFDIRITELDVRLPDGTDNLAPQGAIFGAVASICRAQPRCKALTIWGFTDKFSWIPGTFPGFGRAHPLDANYAPKPAWTALRTAMQ